MRSTMWDYAGIIRMGKRLEQAKSDLEYLLHRIEKFCREETGAREKPLPTPRSITVSGREWTEP